jgi:uncharacterized protein YkwD
VKTAATAAGIVLLAATRCAMRSPQPEPVRLTIRAPDLTHPLSESFPAAAAPEDPVKKGVFERINSDRAAQGLPPVAWDDAASRVADVFTAEQVHEGTRGHFLQDGLPPYARTGLAGVFGMGAENLASWTTTGQSFNQPALALALGGEGSMMAEKPPDDGHRLTILDPDATHVGVGWAQGGGQFRMAEEFQTRRLAELTLERVAEDPITVLLRGRTVAGQRLMFVTFASASTPRRLTRGEANAHTRYTYPEARLAFVPEGMKSLHIVGAATEDRLRVGQSGDFSFRFTPGAPGLWTILFHTADGKDKAKPGGLAVLWIEKVEAR